MMGLAVPDRAIWLRTLLAEHTRILSHCGFLSYVPHRMPGDPGLRRLREGLRNQTLRLTGNRIHPMATRIGGLAVDADDAWLQAERQIAIQATQAAEAGIDHDRVCAVRWFDQRHWPAGPRHDPAVRGERPGSTGKRRRS